MYSYSLDRFLITLAPNPVWTRIPSILAVGSLAAVALQLLLTLSGVAIGLSLWKPRGSSGKKDTSPARGALVIGAGILVTVNLALFAAGFLAVRFASVDEPMSGAIAGILVWSAYFLLVTGIAVVSARSAVTSVLKMALGGFRPIVSAWRDRSEDPAPPVPREEHPTDERSRREVESYLSTAPPEKLTSKRIGRRLRELSGDGEAIDPVALNEALARRSDLTEKQKKKIVNRVMAIREGDSDSHGSLGARIGAMIPEAVLGVAAGEILPEIVKSSPTVSALGEGEPPEKIGRAFLERAGNWGGTLRELVRGGFDEIGKKARESVDATRLAILKICLWLFAIFATGAISSALGGWLATGALAPRA
jgi:hypothetical protein